MRTWRIDRVAEQAMEDIVIGPLVPIDSGGVRVVELDPVLDMVEFLLSEDDATGIEGITQARAFLTAHGRLEGRP